MRALGKVENGAMFFQLVPLNDEQLISAVYDENVVKIYCIYLIERHGIYSFQKLYWCGVHSRAAFISFNLSDSLVSFV